MIQIGSPSWLNNDLIHYLEEFNSLYKKRPLSNNHGGMLSPHMFYTWFLTKHYNFQNIIESGIWKGQGTWLFEQASPCSLIFSIDIQLNHRKYISPKVRYFNIDFQTLGNHWDNINKNKTLCFFDDHQNALPRVKYAVKHGFKYLVFEDNYPTGQGDCVSLKQLFDKDGEESKYLHDVIKTYYEFPPIFKNDRNRWGVKWDKYPVKEPLLSKVDKDYLRIYKKDAHNYNWLCFLELK